MKTRAIDVDEKTVERAIEAGQRIVLTRAGWTPKQRLVVRAVLAKAIERFPYHGLRIRYEMPKSVSGKRFAAVILETAPGMPLLHPETLAAVKGWVDGYETAKNDG